MNYVQRETKYLARVLDGLNFPTWEVFREASYYARCTDTPTVSVEHGLRTAVVVTYRDSHGLHRDYLAHLD